MKEVYENFKKYPGLKIFYYLACGFLGSIQPYYSVYLHHFDISPSIIGIITSLIPILSFVGAPIWTGLADKFKKQKQVLILNCLITMTCLLLLIPINGNIIGIFIFISIYSVSQAPIFPIIDTIVLIELGDKDSKLYGQQRLFAALSYGLNAFVCEKEIELEKEKEQEDDGRKEIENIPIPLDNNQLPFLTKSSDDTITTTTVTTTKSILLNNENQVQEEDILEIKLSDQQQVEEEIKKEGEKLTTGKVLLNIAKDPHMIIFLFAIMIVGMTANIIANFLFLYLQDHKNASSALLGSTMPFTVSTELPLFLYSDKLLKYIGINKMIMIGHSAFIIRLCLYNILTIESVSAWFVLPIELLHGVGFSFTWCAGIQLCTEMAPRGYETTYQGIFFGIYAGLGAALGSIIGGFLYEHMGPIFLFRFTAIAATFSLIVFSLTQLYFKKNQMKRTNSAPLISSH